MTAGITRHLTKVDHHLLQELCHLGTRRVEDTLLAAGILTPGKQLIDFMQLNKMAGKEEEVFDVFSRATSFLAEAGHKFHSDQELNEHYRQFLYHTATFQVVLGSPMLTNGGRVTNKSVSACSIPPVHFATMNRAEISRVVGEYHLRGMGTGFCLDDVQDPVGMVKYLNESAIREVQEGKIERSVGNMGVLSVEHPKILEFVRLKRDHPEIKEWKFNLSVNITDNFLRAWQKKEPFAEMLMQQIAENAHATGDPGLVFMDRINANNKTPHVGSYKTVVTCGEVSLFEGEVCQFAYLNLPRFLIDGVISQDLLRQAIHSTVRLLDNAVEANSKRMPNEQSADLISSLRRIGIGVCGFAEVLQEMGLSYDSPEARMFAADLISFINFESKWASVALAKERGPFRFFDHSETRKHLFIQPFAKNPTRWVSSQDWQRLQVFFDAYKIRNVSTTILPPSGRSSLMAGVTASIEPPFRLTMDLHLKAAIHKQYLAHGYAGDVEAVCAIVQKTGSMKEASIPEKIKDIFKTAQEIAPQDHLAMMATFQRGIDEGISKTVNLPHEATVQDVEDIFASTYEQGLRGVTIYRDGCRQLQPKALSNEESSQVILDSLYGPVRITKRIEKLLASPLLKRLQGIHQNGVHYLVDGRLATSRYEHSVGVMTLTQMLGADESTQITALLHDISHSAFSHLVDAVFHLPTQDYHERKRGSFLDTPLAKETIRNCAITAKELDHNNCSLIKADKDLTVDRLDYVLRDLRAVNCIYHPEYSIILNQLVVQDGVIHCKNIETAFTIFEKFLMVNQKVYFDPHAEVATIAMTTLLRKMLDRGLLKEEDFFSIDDDLIAKIAKSPFQHIFASIGPKMQFFSTFDKRAPLLQRKLRYIDPRIVGLPGRLTDHSIEAKKMLDSYLSIPTEVRYKIPLLESEI